MNYHLKTKTENRKLGPISASYSDRKACPDNCPFKSKGCYANCGPLAIHWRKVSNGERGTTFKNFLKQVSRIQGPWRYAVAGDLPGLNNRINCGQLQALVKANTGKSSWSYTHKPVTGNSEIAKRNREAIKNANDNGFTINLSANSPVEADELVALNVGPVCTTIPSSSDNRPFSTPAGHKVIVCPQELSDNITCSTCRLCRTATRKSIIGFKAHGSQKKLVDNYINSHESYQPQISRPSDTESKEPQR